MKKILSFIFVLFVFLTSSFFVAFAAEDEIVIDEHYKITYITKGAFTNNNPIEYTKGESYEFVNPAKPGYNFEGWFLESSYQTLITEITPETVGDLTLYAKWKLATYSINFNSDGGTNIETINYTLYSDDIILPTPEKEGYNFLGWYSERGWLYKAIKSGDYGDLNLTARWALKKYQVVFDCIENPVVFEHGNLPILPIPEKEGYNFLGWYENDVLVETLAENRDYNLVAKWEIKEYTVNINTNDGITENKTINFIHGEIPTLDIPTKEWHNFLGWYDNDVLVEELTNKDYNLVGKWELKEIKYNATTSNKKIDVYVIGGTTYKIMSNGIIESAGDCEIVDDILYLYADSEIKYVFIIGQDLNLIETSLEALMPCQIAVLESEYGEVVKDVNAGQIGQIVNFQIKPYMFYKVVEVEVNGVKLSCDAKGNYVFSLVEGDNNIIITYDVNNSQLSILAENLANIKNGNWEDIFNIGNLMQVVSWFITIFFSAGYLVLMVKGKKLKAKTTDEVVDITNNTINDTVNPLITNFLDNAFAPIVTNIDSKLVSTEEACKTLARCFVLSQENTPEARLAIINELTALQKNNEDLSKQVKSIILEEVEKAKEAENKKKVALKELEKQNDSIKVENKTTSSEGRY